MAIVEGLHNNDLSRNNSEGRGQEIFGAIDQLHVAISNMAAVLRHPTITSTLHGNLQNRRRTAVRTIMRIRNLRDNNLGVDLFNDPAWSILLDCYACDLDERRISVSDACVASGAPYTTALRWLRALEDRALIERKGDINDRRRAFVVLTPRARTTVESLIDRMIQAFGGFAGSIA